MSGAIGRITAVVGTDVRLRVRRVSSIAIVLLLCVLVYRVVPDPSSGHAIVQVDGHRALNNSATIAIVTAALTGITLALLGFYLVSSTVRRDRLNRTGLVIAATPIRNVEYLIGKFTGSVVFLGLVVVTCMINVMGMHLIRGEAPLQPLVYLATYALITVPVILVVASLALLFECVPLLAGRFGDVLYLGVWMVMIRPVNAAIMPTTRSMLLWDIVGFRFLRGQMDGGQQHASLSIGLTAFDPAKSLWIFPGIVPTPEALLSRCMAAAIALPFFLLAWWAFRRFDPVLRGGQTTSRWHPLAALNGFLKPVSGWMTPAIGVGSGMSRLVVAEIALSFMLAPVAIVALAIAWLAGLLAPVLILRSTVLPLTLLAVMIAIADIVPRDGDAGTTALLRTMPRMRERQLAVKMAAATGVALLFVGIPLLRLIVDDPGSALSLMIGVTCVAAAATCLGTLTRGAKAFAAAFLLFFFIVMNSKGSPGADFAGFFGVATAVIRIRYAAATIGFLLLAATAVRIRREG